MDQKTSNTSLAKALSQFQSELPNVTLDGENPHFRSKFATLANMTHTVLPALAKHGLSFTTAPQVTDQGFVLEATLLHESGEMLTASLPIGAGKPQDVGSALTYYRRYALAALTGVVADDDDDGNTAQAAAPKKSAPKPPAEWRKKIAEAQTESALNEMYDVVNRSGWATDEVIEALTARKNQINANA